MNNNIYSKKEFCDVIKKLIEAWNAQEKINDLLEVYNAGCIKISDMSIEVALNALLRMFDDKEGYIGDYFVNADEEGNIQNGFVIIDGYKVVMSNPGDLYDLLIKKMAEKAEIEG